MNMTRDYLQSGFRPSMDDYMQLKKKEFDIIVLARKNSAAGNMLCG